MDCFLSPADYIPDYTPRRTWACAPLTCIYLVSLWRIASCLAFTFTIIFVAAVVAHCLFKEMFARWDMISVGFVFVFSYYKLMPKGRQLMRFFPEYNYLQHTWNHVVIYSTPQVKLFTVLLSTLPSVQILDMSGTWPRTNRSRVQPWATTVVWRENEVTTWPNIRKVCLGFTLGGHCLIICCGQKTCELWSWQRYSTLFTFFSTVTYISGAWLCQLSKVADVETVDRPVISR